MQPTALRQNHFLLQHAQNKRLIEIQRTAEFGSSPAPAHFTTKTGIRLPRDILHVGTQNSDLKQIRQHSFQRSPS